MTDRESWGVFGTFFAFGEESSFGKSSWSVCLKMVSNRWIARPLVMVMALAAVTSSLSGAPSINIHSSQTRGCLL